MSESTHLGEMMKGIGGRDGVRVAEEERALDKKEQKRKGEDEKKRMPKMTYGKEERLFRLALDI